LKKIFASQVKVGMELPCDVYNKDGVLLWVAGSTVKSTRQAEKLANDGYRTELQEWIVNKGLSKVVNGDTVGSTRRSYNYNTVVDAILELQLPVNYIFDVFKTDNFFKEKRNLTPQIDAVVDAIIDMCDNHEDETIGTIHMFREGKFGILNAVYNCIMTVIICKSIKVKDKYQRSLAAAALTANGSIVKLMDGLCTQKTNMSNEQKQEYQIHPENSVMLLTRAGVRDPVLLDTVYMHHELLDGSGFPRGIKDDQIPVGARVLAIADAYVNLILPKQSMQQALSPPKALVHLFKKNSKRFDRKIMNKGISRLGAIPPGTFVELKDGGVGIVLNNNGDAKTPVITKVGDSITRFYSEFPFTARFSVERVIPPPMQVPKKLFKLWASFEAVHKPQ